MGPKFPKQSHSRSLCGVKCREKAQGVVFHLLPQFEECSPSIVVLQGKDSDEGPFWGIRASRVKSGDSKGGPILGGMRARRLKHGTQIPKTVSFKVLTQCKVQSKAQGLVFHLVPQFEECSPGIVVPQSKVLEGGCFGVLGLGEPRVGSKKGPTLGNERPKKLNMGPKFSKWFPLHFRNDMCKLFSFFHILISILNFFLPFFFLA